MGGKEEELPYVNYGNIQTRKLKLELVLANMNSPGASPPQFINQALLVIDEIIDMIIPQHLPQQVPQLPNQAPHNN